MASIASIAARRDLVTRRLQHLADQLVEKHELKMTMPALPWKRSPELAHVIELEYYADLLDGVAKASGLKASKKADPFDRSFVSEKAEPTPQQLADEKAAEAADKSDAKGGKFKTITHKQPSAGTKPGMKGIPEKAVRATGKRGRPKNTAKKLADESAVETLSEPPIEELSPPADEPPAL